MRTPGRPHACSSRQGGRTGRQGAAGRMQKQKRIARHSAHQRARHASQRPTCLSVEPDIHLNMWRTRASPAHMLPAVFSLRGQAPRRVNSGRGFPQAHAESVRPRGRPGGSRHERRTTPGRRSAARRAHTAGLHAPLRRAESSARGALCFMYTAAERCLG